MHSNWSTGQGVDETIRRRFEADRKAGTAVQIESYLPPAADPQFLPTLEELVHIDLEWAWKGAPAAEKAPRVEAYLDRFPQLQDPTILQRLLHQEYRVRQRFGDRPSTDEFRGRFPDVDVSAWAAVTVAAGSSTAVEGSPEVPGYELFDVLGRGGMGLVYRARQVALNRIVALKVIRGKAADAITRARFRTEAEAAARLNHRNIVQVYEVGEAQGQPYLALEFVGGGSLEGVLRGTPQAPRFAAETVEVLARAVHAAHQSNVLHRDLKPANILLAAKPADAEADGTLPWVPKVADFGLAKQLGTDSGQTETGDILGTPSYMAPEQASGSTAIGPGADVYGLGGILYEMLSGRPPFRAANLFDTIAQVMAEEPVPPSRFQPALPRDLETICLKCLEKDPARRYGAAADLANDLRRFLQGEAISARRVGSVERMVRWAKRRPTAAGLLAALLVAALATSAGAVALYFNGKLQAALVLADARRVDADEQRALAESRKVTAEASANEANAQRGEADRQRTIAEQQRLMADQQRERAEQYQYYAQVNLARQAWTEGDVPRMLDLLDRYVPPKPGGTDRRGVEWYYVRRLSRNLYTLRGHTHDVNAVALHPNGRLVATASYDNTVRIWDAVAGKHLYTLRHTPRKANDTVWTVAFLPDGKHLVATAGSTVTMFDTDKWQPKAAFAGHADSVAHVAFDASGNRMATSSLDGTAIVWDVATAKPVFSLAGEKGEKLSTVRFVPGGAGLIWLSNSGTLDEQGSKVTTGCIKGWDLNTRKEVFRQKWSGKQVYDLAVDPDGRRIAVAGRDGTVHMLSWPDGTDLYRIDAHAKGVTSVQFSRDGRRLVTAGYDLTVRVWAADGGTEQLTLRGHTGRPAREKELGESGVSHAVFSPDGRRAVSAGDDHTVRVWDVGPPPESPPPTPPKPKSGVYSPDRTQHAEWVRPAVQIRDRVSGAAIRALPTDLKNAVTLWYGGRGGQRIVVEFGKPVRDQVQVWDVASGRSLIVARVDADADVNVSADGRWLTATNTRARLWDLETAKVVTLPVDADVPVGKVVVSPDRRRVATILDHKAVWKREWTPKLGEVKIWDVETGRLVSVLRGHTWMARTLAWAPDGQTVATAGMDATIRLWNAETGQPTRAFTAHVSNVYEVAFNADGTRLVSGGEDKTVRLWDPALGEEVLVLKGSAEYVWSVAFDPVSKSIVSRAGMSDTRTIWDARPLDQ